MDCSKHRWCKKCRPDIASKISSTVSTTLKQKYADGYINGFKGRKHSRDSVAKISQALRAKHPELLRKHLVKNGIKGHAQRIKLLLIEQGVKEDSCENCGIPPLWNNLPLVLQLDHINGDSQDWRIENLRILCPNCHTQTSTWGFKKRIQ